MKKNKVVVIGGGPAGMLSAISAAQKGAEVFILEKNNELGQKLLLTGGGRCNFSNIKISAQSAVELYGKTKGKFLATSLRKFDQVDTVEFFEKLDLKFITDKEGRLIPQSEKAVDVLKALKTELEKLDVEIIYQAQVKKIICENKKVSKIIYNSQEIRADKIIIACGGQTYPQTGSAGDGYTLAKDLGHEIVSPQPILSPVVVEADWLKSGQGIGLDEVVINKKYSGNLMITHYGLSGSAVFNYSRENFIYPNSFRVNFVPSISEDFLRKEFIENIIDKKSFEESVRKYLPRRLVEILFSLIDLSLEDPNSQVSKAKMEKLLTLIKHCQFEAKSVLNSESAMVTSGGVSLKQVNPGTLESKIVENLYFAGEILDLDGPTGGYNLQIAWSTGYVAGLTK